MPVPPPLDLATLQRLNPSALAAFLANRRWFAGRTHQMRSARFVDATVPGAGGWPEGTTLAVLAVEYDDAPPERYGLPLAIGLDAPEPFRIGSIDGLGPLADGLAHPSLGQAILGTIARGDDLPTAAGAVVAGRTTSLLRSLAPDADLLPVRYTPVEQSHTLLNCGDTLGLKLYRKLESGINLDLEVGRFLTETAGFVHSPPIAGWLEYRPANPGTEPTVMGLLQGWVANSGTGWDRALRVLRDGLPPGDPGGDAALLGLRTGQMHLALASRPDVAGFEPRPLTRDDLTRFHRSAVEQVNRSFDLLEREQHTLRPALLALSQPLLKGRSTILARLDSLKQAEPSGQMIRVHGDYHLGQTLRTADDYVLIDFEGEPLRPLAERRQVASPWKDVAGMARSFDYAANNVGDAMSLEVAKSCYSGTDFLDAYDDATAGASFRMADSASEQAVFRGFLIEKAAYELQYELSHRPEWAFIPLGGLAALLDVD
jgi:maltose alpha-D-glucosyltransferase/alpha-amylase